MESNDPKSGATRLTFTMLGVVGVNAHGFFNVFYSGVSLRHQPSTSSVRTDLNLLLRLIVVRRRWPPSGGSYQSWTTINCNLRGGESRWSVSVEGSRVGEARFTGLQSTATKGTESARAPQLGINRSPKSASLPAAATAKARQFERRRSTAARPYRFSSFAPVLQRRQIQIAGR
jgi:hypothetical protein